MIAYKLQLKIIVMPLIIMIIMISGAGPRTRPARKKAGTENWFSTQTQQAAVRWERGVAETGCTEGTSQEGSGLSGSSGPAPLRFWPQIPGSAGESEALLKREVKERVPNFVLSRG